MFARQVLMPPDGHVDFVAGTDRIGPRRNAGFELLQSPLGVEWSRLMALGGLEGAVVVGGHIGQACTGTGDRGDGHQAQSRGPRACGAQRL